DLFMDEAGFMAALERKVPGEAQPAPACRPPAGAQPTSASLPPAGAQPASASLPPAGAGLMTIEEMERRLIGRALDETEGNRTHAARILGISVRTLRNKLAEYRVSA
ncbi:MAG: helix-turn-helix domain-containing protein, partial [Candidatus Adiutrix sp.]|nr:helix-turn-helix domain-containing protein [Candidatus Adiutrix sp.]